MNVKFYNREYSYSRNGFIEGRDFFEVHDEELPRFDIPTLKEYYKGLDAGLEVDETEKIDEGAVVVYFSDESSCPVLCVAEGHRWHPERTVKIF